MATNVLYCYLKRLEIVHSVVILFDKVNLTILPFTMCAHVVKDV